MRVRKTPDSIRGWVCILGLLLVGGCTIRIGPRDGDQPAAPTDILITMVNDTDTALDPQLYVGAVADGLDHLYDRGNQRTDFGLGARGIVEPGAETTVSTACDPAVFISTLGGLFGDDLNAPIGQGQPIVLEQDQNVRCGDRVTFTFSASGGTLRTSFSVGPQ